MTDSPIASPDAPSVASWVTVSDAADKARVDTRTVRHWYRTGRIPTQRSEGAAGAFLVPLDAVLALAKDLGDEQDAAATASTEMDASYWALQAEAAREEAALAREESAAANARIQEISEQLTFLRSQLSEMSEENRNLREQLENSSAEVALANADADRLRNEAASVSSITDFSWLDRTRAYESPIRPQQRLGTNTGAVSGLLADAQPDDSATGESTGPRVGPSTVVVRSPSGALPHADEESRPDFSDIDPVTSANVAVPAAAPPEHDYGMHEDDLLPEPDKRGRRRT